MSADDEANFRRPRAIFAIFLVLVFGFLPVTAAEAATPKHAVVSSWKNKNKTKIELRLGVYNAATGKGFGWTKIKKRHGIKKYSTVRHPTKSPYGALWKGKPRTRAEYTAFAVKWQRVGGRWIATDQRQVITVVEFKHVASWYKVKFKGAPGVLTTYCRNPNGALKCPSWVDTAFLPKNNGMVVAYPGTGTPGSGQIVTSSYKPVRLGQVAVQLP